MITFRIAACASAIVLTVAACGGSAATSARTGTATVAPTAAASAAATPMTAPTSGPATPAPTTVPTAARTAAPTGVNAPATAAPTAQATAQPTVAGEGGCAWVGTFGYGLACLDDGGWRSVVGAAGDLRSDQIQDLASCADGRTWVASTLGLQVTDGTAWVDVTDRLNGKTPEAIACDPAGGVWAGGFGFVGRVTEAEATLFDTTELGTGEFANQVKDVAVAADGTAWVITPNSVARYDGSAWRFWEQGAGFDDTVFLNGLAVGSNGVPWIGTGSGLFSFDGTAWTELEAPDLGQIEALAVDATNRVWAGTYSNGVSVWDGSAWKAYTRDSSTLPSDHVKAIAVDGAGRVWLGTEYGLAVADGDVWAAYHMHTSGLVDNDIAAVSIVGVGPVLPALVEEQAGTLVGRVVRDGAPLPEATVEICVEFIGSSFVGDSPCADQPFTKLTKTGADGGFTLDALPPGRYTITLQTPDGKWLRVTDQFSLGVEKATVEPGETTDLGELDLTGD